MVWLATDELLGRDVAIKEAIPPPGLIERDWHVFRQRGLHEAQAAARLHHPNIASVYDVISHDDRSWIVMQLVPYPSLQEVLRASGPMSPVDAAHMGLRILGAMRAAHSAGVLHRDIKPANILLGPDGDVVLTDFGLAVADTRPHLTLTGTVVGSPAYMSPERARGEKATLASDLWSLGATLYAAVEGRDPFARSTTMAVLTAVVYDEPDPPQLCGPLWPVINALLRKDPRFRQRPDDAERRLAWAAGVLAEPGVTGPVVALDTRASTSDNAARGGSLKEDFSPAAIMADDGSGLFASGDHPPDNPDRRQFRWPTAAWLLSGLAGILLIAAIIVIASLADGHEARAPAQAHSPRVGSTPATQAHTSQPPMQPGRPAALSRPAATQSAPPTVNVQPGRTKKRHAGHKPRN